MCLNSQYDFIDILFIDYAEFRPKQHTHRHTHTNIKITESEIS